VLHNSSKKKLCRKFCLIEIIKLYIKIFLNFLAAYPHRAGNIIKQGSIIQKKCGVKYTKIVPLDIEQCPYVILISRGVHSHPPPPPNRVPITIRSRLQDLIRQANDDTSDVTPTRIVTGNYVLFVKILMIFIN